MRESLIRVQATDFLPLHGYTLDVLGEVLATAGRVDDAGAALDRARVIHERKGNVVSAGRSGARLAELRASSAPS